jgi:hypothetical protein
MIGAEVVGAQSPAAICRRSVLGELPRNDAASLSVSACAPAGGSIALKRRRRGAIALPPAQRS